MMTYLLMTMSLLAQGIPTATADLENLGKALDMYYTDCGHYPRQLEGILRDTDNCGERWGPEPYIKTIPLDPWGRAYEYRSIWKNNFELRTLGADGREGGLGDDMDIVLER